jgi:branched-subunit amino acid ABC-type transport system permease component
MIFLQTLINGLLLGALYALIAMGLTLIFGVMRIINLAHGEFTILGAYTTYWTCMILGIHPLLSLTVSILLGVLLGLLTYFTLTKRIVYAPELTTLLAFFGLSMILQNLMLLLWKADIRGLPTTYPSIVVGGITIIGDRLVAAITALIVSFTLLLFLRYSYLGRAIRAVVQDFEVAPLIGINVHRIYALSMCIGLALTSAGGSLLALTTPFTPYVSGIYTLYSFLVVVLGGLGNPIGSLVGGLIVGVAISFTATYWIAGISPTIAFVLLVLILLLKPEGILSRRR